MKRTLEQILTMAGGLGMDHAPPSLVVQGVSTDSRTLAPGNLFIPLVGKNVDGHQFAEEARQKGAIAALWQEGHPLEPPRGFPVIRVDDTLQALQRLAHAYRSQLNVRVIAVTGSNGKTTTKDMIASILATTYRVHKTQGNLNNHIGLPLTLLSMDEQTEMAVIEMGMSGRGEIALLSRLALPECAVVTNIGESHLLQLGSREEIARAKVEILGGLSEGGLFVYNGDEPLIEQAVMEPSTPKPSEWLRYRFGFGSDNDIYPLIIMMESTGTTFKTNLPGSGHYRIPMLGRHNVVNALAAVAVCKYMGVQDADIAEGFRNLKPTGMRIERITTPSGITILNDAYNASPTSMKAAIELLQELPGYNRKLAVLGDMLELGPEEVRFHQEIGQLAAASGIDRLFAYGPLAKYLVAEAAKWMSPGKACWFDNKDQLIDALLAEVKQGDIVLVKGSRSMRLEEVVYSLKNV